MYFTRKEIHKYEFTGAVVALLGAFLMMMDPYARRVGQPRSWQGLGTADASSTGNDGLSEDSSQSSTWVDFTLLFSNIPACLLFALNKSLMKDRFIAHLFFVNLFTMCGFIVLTLLYEGATLDMNPYHGVFAWLRPANQFNTIILLGFLATFWSSAVGYTLLMRITSPHLCLNMLLLEPVIAQLYGVAFGIDHSPGSLTLFGQLAVVLGGVCYINEGAVLKQRDKERVRREYEDLGRGHHHHGAEVTTVESWGVLSSKGRGGGREAAGGRYDRGAKGGQGSPGSIDLAGSRYNMS